MASVSAPKAAPFYGSVNPSILGDFDDEEEDDFRFTLPVRPANTQQQPPSTTNPRSSGAFLGYNLAYNPSLLDVGFDDEESESSGRPTPTGSSVEDEPAQVTPCTSTTPQTPLCNDPFPDTRFAKVTRSSVCPSSSTTTTTTAVTTTITSTSTTTTTSAEPLSSNNPYAALIEEKQKALTVAFLSSPDLPAELDGTPIIQPDDLGFGQRYHVARDTSAVVISNQRKVTDLLTGDRDCIICTYTKGATEFPAVAITKDCTHEINTCLACITTCIRTDLQSRLWDDIRCPECRAKLEPSDVQRLADNETNERYQTLAFRAALSTAPNFIWCTAGCGMGQVHEGGAEQPIVTCLQCNHRSCFHHKVAWHQNMTCEEYDSLLADPENFRSWFDTTNEEAERALRAQLEADRAYAQSLLEEEQRAEAERVAALERAAREEREKRERAERDKEQKRLKDLAKRRKQEEEASAKTVNQTTKPCPGCRAPIEKNQGCQHMTCSKCKHEFCWDCMADYKMIRAYDNSKHDRRCPWYPDNIKD
ncbi:hypothetical protein VTJ49DRAFT_1647 [Mycothermus thermophilus]|uniref:RBR-type E3 ubiquitin transferase n=1 Tax=Humicola insolens TaxID=85995 RepID=A0ABR3VBU5_HUMIN